MTDRENTMWKPPVIIVVALGLVALGAASTYFMMKGQLEQAAQRTGPAVQHPPSDPPRAAGPELNTPAAAPQDVALTLSKEAVDRAGIVVGPVTASAGGSRIRVPAIVEPNAYKSVVVTPVIPGRVTSVSAQLGQRVRRGESLAQVYSPELADIQSRYVASRAELDARTRDLRRTEKLVEIGSASKQELERIHSEQTAAGTMAESLRSQMMLLGVTPSQLERLGSSQQITATVSIPSPMEGVITERTANVGLNVDAATKLFTVVDLASVWLVGNVYERDFGRVRVGSVVGVTTSAYPDMQLEGKVSYIDPSVNAETRTAQLRVEVPNRGGQLRFGMYVEMVVDEPSAERVLVPRAAIQMIGERAVVYLSDPAVAGRFVEREVQLGATTDNQVEIVSGVQAGDPIVITGSFALRAERERRGLGAPSPARAPEAHQPAQPGAARNVSITVSEKGFEPARVSLRAGAPMRLMFVRTTDATCATELAIPALKIKRVLPLNQPVAIDFTPEKPGEIAFACGMDMFTGTLVVQ